MSAKRWFAILPLLVAQFAWAAPGIDPEVRQAVADRTVLVKIPWAVDGKVTGFIWRRVGKTTQIVTLLREKLLVTQFARATVIHHPATEAAKRYAAQVVAYDDRTGLSVVEVDDPALPEPLPVATAPPSVGGDLLLGTCPCGPRGSRRPDAPVSVTKLHLSAKRTTGNGFVLQLDGDIPIGGEGGLVVLPNGQMLGIAAFEYGDTLVSFALPLEVTGVLFSGGAATPCGISTTKPQPSIQVTVPLLDLGEKVQSCSLHIVAKAAARRPVEPEDGRWGLLSTRATEVELPLSRPICTWKQTLEECKLLPGAYWIQAETHLRDGTSRFSPPGHLSVPAPAKPRPKEGAIREQQSIDAVKFDVDNALPPLELVRTKLRELNGVGFVDVAMRGRTNEMSQGTLVRGLPRYLAPNGVAWSLDGNSFYVLSKGRAKADSSEISRFSSTGSKASRNLVLNAAVARLHDTDWGLVVTVLGRGLLILDSKTLQVRTRLQVPGIIDLLVSPRSRGAIAVIGQPFPTHDGTYTQRINDPQAGTIDGLQVVDLAAQALGRTYPVPPEDRADTRERPAALANLQFPLALSGDGQHLVFSTGLGPKEGTYLCRFSGLRLGLSSPIRLGGRVRGLLPEPESTVVLALQAASDVGKEELSGPPPHAGSTLVRLLDTAKPQAKLPHYWASQAAVSADRVFLFTPDYHLQIVNRHDGGKEELWLRNLEQVPWTGRPLALPAPHGGGFLRTADRFIQFSRSAPEKAARPAGEAAGATGHPLTVISKTVRDVQRQHVLTHAAMTEGSSLPDAGSTIRSNQRKAIRPQLPSRASQFGKAPLLDVDTATETAYTLDLWGVLVRTDLASLRETHRLEEGAKGTGLALTQLGVLVAVSNAGKHELVLRAPDDLRLLRRFPLPAAMSNLRSRPNATFAFMSDGQKFWLFDGTTGQLSEPMAGDAPITLACRPVIAADGEHVYAMHKAQVQRLAREGGTFTVTGSTPPTLSVHGCTTVGENGRYLGVRLVKRAALGGIGWDPPPAVPSGGQRENRRAIFAVLDTRSLLPIYQVAVPAASLFVFDASQSQLVTSGLTQCFPDGSISVHALPIDWSREVHGSFSFWACDGWFLFPAPGGFARYRLRTITTSTKDWLQ